MNVIASLVQPLLKPGIFHLLSGKKELIFLTTQKIQTLKCIQDLPLAFEKEETEAFFQKGQIYSFHNGMGHDAQDFINLVTRINHAASQNQLLIHLFNQSQGALTDMSYVAKQKLYFGSDKKDLLSVEMIKLLNCIQTHFPHTSLTHFAHSEAGIICDNMLRSLSCDDLEKTKKYLNIITLGSPRPISNARVCQAINVYSEEDYLVIPFVKMYDTLGEYEFKQIPASSQKGQKHLQIIDHAMLGDSYFEVIEKTLQKTDSFLK